MENVIIVETQNDNQYIVRSYQHKLGEAVGEMYALARKERGLTQQEVAEVSGVKRPNIARLEGGKHSPTVDMLARVADSMGMRLELHLVDKEAETE
jgi:transcriptional regulator with XRE-family HTH domain